MTTKKTRTKAKAYSMKINVNLHKIKEVSMKLIFAIINKDDSHTVSKALTKAGHFATKLASTGGFLSAGNTTFLICTENENVDNVIKIIEEKSHKRKQFVPSAASFGIGTYSSFPVEVSVGGATIFVTDIERFEKV